MKEIFYPIIGLSIIFLSTVIGSALIFFVRKKEISPKLSKIFMGFAAGVMLSASFFSLIKPALESEATYMPIWLIVGLSIILGAGFLWLIDKIVPHFHPGEQQDEGISTRRVNKTSKMFLAVTIHNVPEGLSVGIAFGVALSQPNNLALLSGALLLAIGMGIQNVPEGAVVTLPIKSETGSSAKAFFFGVLSGIVEPISALLGILLATQIQGIMPWALAFSAGCMIYVTVEEMVPELKSDEHNHFGVWSFIIGFVIMMILDCIQF